MRVTLLPVGSNISEERFEELASFLTSWREIPLNVLPRRAVATRTSFNTSASGNATYSHLPSELRNANDSADSSSRFLSRTFSSRSDPRTSTVSSRTSQDDSVINSSSGFSTPQQMAEHFAGRRVPNLPLRHRGTGSRRSRRHSRVPSFSSPEASLNLERSSIDSLLRLRYDVIQRSPSGEYAFRATSNWDSFHSRRVWGVIGIADCTDPELCSDSAARNSLLQEAQAEFVIALKHFPIPCVSRVVVFTTSDAAREQGASVMNSPTITDRPVPLFPEPGADIVFGYVPETSSHSETRQEVRVQIIHFSGLLLNVLDRESWRKEKSSNDLFLTPLDEASTADKHPKLVKRRTGRLDKLLADIQLLMGAPNDALTKYGSAIEKAKANSDRLWLAGAMEGWSTAHVLIHVKNGGSCSDPAFTNKLIEHYSEIYKLYSKKRVAELEASAALRLAEFLGHYTPRRKEALEAADHAAEVGESLPSVKRATLWEALARFSESMKCHRKAAFYLYRVGSLCAGKSVWASSEALLTCSSKQFNRRNGMIWPDLHRDVLMEAGKSAWELGDTFLATHHYVEALSLSAFTLKKNYDGDASLVKLLMETTTPLYLPAASRLLTLHSLGALRVPSLVVKSNTVDEATSEPHTRKALSDKNGPFIYNPFKAEALRKAAAVASRTVTWVCGETGQVTVRIQNLTHTSLPIEIVAVVILDADKRAELLSENSASAMQTFLRNRSLDNASGDMEDENQCAYSDRMKDLLREVANNVKTVSETVTLPPKLSEGFIEKSISVVPRRTGTMQLCGLIIRMFHGTMVMLPTPDTDKEELAAPPIKVIKTLPQLSVSIRQDDGELSSLYLVDKPVIVFEGERRRFSVRISNVGNDDIGDLTIQVATPDSDIMQVFEVGRGYSTIKPSDLKVGLTYDFEVEVFGSRITPPGELNHENCTSRPKVQVGALSVIMSYTGTKNPSLMRQSRATISLALRPAVRISSLTIFQLPMDTNNFYDQSSDNTQSCYGLILDVENLVPVPLMIALPSKWRSPNMFTPSPGDNLSSFGMDSPCPPVNVLECGASTRLITAIPNDYVDGEKKSVQIPTGHEAQKFLSLSWAMPGVGRSGAAEIYRDDVEKVQGSKNTSPNCLDPVGDGEQPRIDMFLVVNDDNRTSRADEGSPNTTAQNGIQGHRSISKLSIRKYYTGTVTVSNRGTCALPEETVLDLCVLQHDGRGSVRMVSCASLIGAVECVRIGALATGESFEHSFKIRFTSTGIFELNSFVHDWRRGSSSEESLQSIVPETGNAVEQRQVDEKNLLGRSTKTIDVERVDPNYVTAANFGLERSTRTGTGNAQPGNVF